MRLLTAFVIAVSVLAFLIGVGGALAWVLIVYPWLGLMAALLTVLAPMTLMVWALLPESK